MSWNFRDSAGWAVELARALKEDHLQAIISSVLRSSAKLGPSSRKLCLITVSLNIATHTSLRFKGTTDADSYDDVSHISASVFQVHGADGAGEVVIRRQLKASRRPDVLPKLRPCRIASGSRASSHHRSRKIGGPVPIVGTRASEAIAVSRSSGEHAIK